MVSRILASNFRIVADGVRYSCMAWFPLPKIEIFNVPEARKEEGLIGFESFTSGERRSRSVECGYILFNIILIIGQNGFAQFANARRFFPIMIFVAVQLKNGMKFN